MRLENIFASSSVSPASWTHGSYHICQHNLSTFLPHKNVSDLVYHLLTTQHPSEATMGNNQYLDNKQN